MLLDERMGVDVILREPDCGERGTREHEVEKGEGGERRRRVEGGSKGGRRGKLELD